MDRQSEPEYMDEAEEAAAYARADFGDVNQAFVDRLLELSGSRTKATALDLGTGPGDVPIRLARQRPAWRIAALDASPAMLEWGHRQADETRTTERVSFVLGDAKATGFTADTFDIIFSNSIVHHINDVASLWCELKRVAKRGALVLLRDLARPESPEAARHIVETYAKDESALLQEEFYRSLLSAYTTEEIRAQLNECGLGSLEVTMVSDRHWDAFGHIR